MKQAFAGLLLALSLSPAIAAESVPLDGLRVTQFQWLSGCWGYSGGGSSYEEVWLAPTGNSMLGVSRRVSDGFTREFEFMRIVTADVSFDFVAQPKGAAPVRFRLEESSGTRAVFENLKNDFPQRVIYEYAPPDQLVARIEGQDAASGQTVGSNFPMRRQACNFGIAP